MTRPNAAIIGAGLAGAACARQLKAAGYEVVLFDKGRGPGGRLSTRRADTPLGEIAFDHGAQFLTARSDSFRAFLAQACKDGFAAEWAGRVVSIDRGGNSVPLKADTRYVGTPGMNAIVKAALHELDARFAHRVTRLSGKPGAWTLRFEDGSKAGPFDRIAITIPPEQLIDLLARSDGDFPEMILEARDARIAPCQAVMAAFDAPFDPGFAGAKLLGGGVRWIARMNSRPGYSGPEAYVLHASPDWSRVHLDAEPEDVIRTLCEEMFVRFGLPRPAWATAHRWLYALSEEAPGTPAAIDETGTVGCGGDWRLGPRAEFAWTSGEALAQRLAGKL